ncbi:MAG: diguanylate cyclase [Coriobacteriia bacterium]|nr:diguanylate cyclase [Coriobacteriia bacterium]
MILTDAEMTDRFINSLGDACVIVSRGGEVTAANELALALYGRPRTEMIGVPFAALCPEFERDVMSGELASCNGQPRAFRALQLRAHGGGFVGEFTAKACHDPDECVVLLVREAQESETLEGDLTLRTLMLNYVTDGIVCHTLDGELLFANRTAMVPWGVSSLDEARALGPFGWVSDEQRPVLAELMKSMIAEGELRFESHGHGPSGAEAHLEIHSVIIESAGQQIVISSVRDVSERMENEEAMRYLAYHDTLTGLANRVLLESELAHALALSDRYGDKVGVIFLDLNDFKPVNDTYGHAVGDDVLREVANRLAGAIRESDTVARPGGDEFVVLVPRLTTDSELTTIAAKLAAEIARPMDLGSTTITVSASLGSAIRQPGENAESLLTRADLAMYRSRKSSPR